MGLARFPVDKDLDRFHFDTTPINEMQVRTLYTGAFLADHTNIIMVGGTGSGKTHLAIAIARIQVAFRVLAFRLLGFRRASPCFLLETRHLALRLLPAAAFMVLGQSVESSAGDPTQAGKLKNEFFYEFVLDRAARQRFEPFYPGRVALGHLTAYHGYSLFPLLGYLAPLGVYGFEYFVAVFLVRLVALAARVIRAVPRRQPAAS